MYLSLLIETEKTMRVHFVNVGYGEAILIEKEDFYLLVDGGTHRREEYEAPGTIRVAEYLNKLGIPRIDMIILTHIHDDHVGGLPEVIRRFPVTEVLINMKSPVPSLDMIENFESVKTGNLSGTLFRNALFKYAEFCDLCSEKGIPIRQIDVDLGPISPVPGLMLEFLTPDRQLQEEILEAYHALCNETDPEKAETLFYEIDKRGNSTSIAMRIKAANTAVLLSGDKADSWDAIQKKHGDSLRSEILKLTHHGQIDGLPEAMLEVSQPNHFVICASADRRFNSAHPQIVERIKAYLEKEGKQGGVYVTGSLCDQVGDSTGENPCSVIFECDEDTGAITVNYMK